MLLSFAAVQAETDADIKVQLPDDMIDAVLIPVATLHNSEKSNGFPSSYSSKYDPVNKKKYQNVVHGIAQKARSRSGYNYWRYVTLYNKKRRKDERITNLPAIKEECHDGGWNFGQWSQQISYQASLTAKVEAKVLGFGASVAASLTHGSSYTVRRNVNATEGIEAIHTPYLSSKNWSGVSYIQTYNRNSRTIGYLAKRGSYPYMFRLTQQDLMLKVLRTDVRVCPGYENDVDVNPIKKSDIEKLGSY